MGMRGYFFPASDDTIRRVLADPARVQSMLFADDMPPDALAAAVLTTENARHAAQMFDVDKNWHGLHHLLTGTAYEGEPPLNFIFAGTPIGEEDLNYGPPRAFFYDEVRALHGALAGLDHDQLRGRFEPAKMDAAGVYPVIGEYGRDVLDALLRDFDRLKGFVSDLNARGLGMIATIA